VRKKEFPRGWDEERVKRVLEHYEQQSEEEAVAEDEAAFEHEEQVFIEVPSKLVSKVRNLIAEYEATAETE